MLPFLESLVSWFEPAWVFITSFAGGSFLAPVTVGIIGVVSLITIRTAINLLWVQWAISREKHAVSNVTQQLHERQKSEEHLSSTDISVWSTSLHRQSSVRMAIEGAWAIRHLPNADFSAVISAVHQHESERLAPFRSTPNILLLMGMLGTVFGLSFAIAHLGPQISASLEAAGLEALNSTLGSTLDNMRFAFYSTLAGIIGALLVSWFLRATERQQGKFLQKLEQLCIVELAPAFFPPSHEAQIQGFQRILEDSSRALKEMQDGANQMRQGMQDAADTFKDVLVNVGQSMSGSVDKLETTSKNMTQALTDVGGQVLESTNALERGTLKLKESAEELDRHHTYLQNAYTQMDTLFREAQAQASQQMKENLDAIRVLQLDFAKSASSIVQRVDKAAMIMTESGTAFHDAGTQYVKESNNIQVRIGHGFDTLHDKLAPVLENHQLEMTKVEQSLERSRSIFASINQRLNGDLLPKAEWNAAVAGLERLAAQLTVVGEMQQSSLQGATDSLQGVTKGIAALNSNLDAYTKRLEAREVIIPATIAEDDAVTKSLTGSIMPDMASEQLDPLEEYGASLAPVTLIEPHVRQSNGHSPIAPAPDIIEAQSNVEPK